MIVSIDPGVRALGWASFLDRGTLVACGLSRAPQSSDLSAALAHHRRNMTASVPVLPDAVALESMWATRGRGVPPQDLINVQTIGVGVAASLGGAHVVLYYPTVWKGTIPKDVHHRRIVDALEPGERACLSRALGQCPKNNRKEILDAAGIGLYHLQRTNRSGGSRHGS